MASVGATGPHTDALVVIEIPLLATFSVVWLVPAPPAASGLRTSHRCAFGAMSDEDSSWPTLITDVTLIAAREQRGPAPARARFDSTIRDDGDRRRRRRSHRSFPGMAPPCP